jgi:hypothetical protein
MTNSTVGKVERRSDLVFSQCTTVTAIGGYSGDKTRPINPATVK